MEKVTKTVNVNINRVIETVDVYFNFNYSETTSSLDDMSFNANKGQVSFYGNFNQEGMMNKAELEVIIKPSIIAAIETEGLAIMESFKTF